MHLYITATTTEEINQTLEKILSIASMCATKGTSNKWKLDTNGHVHRYIFDFDADTKNYQYYANVTPHPNGIELNFHYDKDIFKLGYSEKITMLLNAIFPQQTTIVLSIFDRVEINNRNFPCHLPS